MKENEKTFELWYTLPAFGCSRPIDLVRAKDKMDARRKLKKKRNFKNTETEIYSIHEARKQAQRAKQKHALSLQAP